MARLSKDELLDTSRYKFSTEEVDLPELGGSVQLKQLSVEERDKLPSLIDEDGRPNASVEGLAEVWAVVVADPKLTVEEAKAFLGKLPGTALDRVIEKFGEMMETSEEAAAEKRRDFRSETD